MTHFFKLLLLVLSYICFSSVGYCGTIYLMPQINYGVSVLENTIVPVISYNTLLLYNFDNSPFIVGGKVGYATGNSDTIYTIDSGAPQGINSYTRTSTNPFVGISGGAVLNIANNFKSMILVNVQKSIGASYNVNCQYNTSICVNQSGNQLNILSFGIENDFLYSISTNWLLGLNTGLLYSTTTFNNYTSLNNTAFTSSRTGTSTMPYIGFSLGYKF